jgi:hypothetical protein
LPHEKRTRIINNFFSLFSIDKFSGVLSLQTPLDREKGERYTLLIAASDGAHKAVTEVVVLLKDENDCQPVFDRPVGPS